MELKLTLSQRKQLIMLMMTFAVSVIMAGYAFEAQAQRSGFFTVNNKQINIDSLGHKINFWMNEVGVPAISLAVISNGQVVFADSYGHKRQGSEEKVNSETVFEACSMTKSYLVYVVYKLVDSGVLDLDKPMYQYLTYEPLEYDPRYKLITPRMILSHSSGLENWRDMNDGGKLEILSTPGEKFIYSGEGYQYLAKVVEKLLNKPYEKYIREMVIEPLKLKRTFTSYTHNGKFPKNDATGHDAITRPINKNRNLTPIPAAGIHFIAADYAKLIVSTFDKKHLSNNRFKDLTKPMVRIQQDNQSVYYGPGFEIIYSSGDTIISQGGSNDGFKNMMFYSIVSKSGFVFLTNSDRGKALAAKLCEATVGLNITPKLESTYFEQYPSVAIDLLKTFKNSSAEKMFLEIEKLSDERKIAANTLLELADIFLYYDMAVARRLIERTIQLDPNSIYAYRLMGIMNMGKRNYQVAYDSFEKTKKLGYDDPMVDYAIELCKAKIKANASMTSRAVNIDTSHVATIQAENYSAMSGIDTAPINDNGADVAVGWINADDWMEYKVEVDKAGTYALVFRVASPAGAALQIRSGTEVLVTLKVPQTKGWNIWTTTTTEINLPAGGQTLRLHALADGFNVNWFQFSKPSADLSN